MRYMTALLLLVCSCAGGSPRFTDRAEQVETPAMPVVQVADLAGELLVAPPEKRADQVLSENPESVLPLMGMGETPPPVTTEVLQQLPDTTEVTTPVVERGPRREYQIQVAITPSAEEAEDFKERLTLLLEPEKVFVIFTSPYYRIRVGRKPTREAADELLRRLHDLGYTGAMVIPITITPDRDAS